VKIDRDKCTVCGQCIPYCPLGAIKLNEKKTVVYIHQDECVECGVCFRSGICESEAIYQPKLTWPRILRAMWSSVVHIHKETGSTGRGTEEMKTNDVTGRFALGEVGFGIELGRPTTGARFEDTEKVTKAVAKHGVEFEQKNPLTRYIDTKTGLFLDSWEGHPLDESFRKTKVMTSIVEFKTDVDRIMDILETIKSVSREINTTMSIEIITKCTKEGDIPLRPFLDQNGIEYYINGKTCVGLGKPTTPSNHD
jgi:NAD-dependent dihydropyrimidine dehydrogenase PreA subunit